MVYIKANNEIIKVYQNVITSKKERVEWNGDIVIRKNAMILVGRLRSMYFELSSRRVYSDIEEFSLDPAKAFEIKDNILLTNIINMMLYPFVKWGAIKGINVEKDYMVLAALFSQIFKEIDVQTYFTKTSMKFFNDEIQITFEDAMEKCIEHIEEQREDREFLEKLEGSIEDKDTGKNILQDDGGAEIYKGYTKDGRIVNINPERGIRTKAGLWHSIRWIIGSYDFKKEKFDEEYCGYINSNTMRAGYPESKRCGEALCQAYIRQKELDVVIPRLTRSYGPTLLESDTKALSQFLKKGIQGEDIVLKSQGTQYYSYTYMVDAVSGLLTVLLKGKCGEAYNIADDASDIMLKDLATIIAEYAGTKVVFEIPDEVEAVGYSKATKARLESKKLQNLGWKAKYDIDTGIKRTMQILRKRSNYGKIINNINSGI